MAEQTLPEKLLTIGILFCDKDYQYVDKLTSTIEKNIKNVDYEIVLVDNREEKKLETVNSKTKYTTITNAFNKRQLLSRKSVIDRAESSDYKYIWFIDADDNIPEIDFSKIELTSEINVFSEKDWLVYKDKIHFPPNYPMHLKLKRAENISALWQCIISRNLLKKVSNSINEKDIVSVKEDAFIINKCVSLCTTLEFKETIIYEYNKEKSTALVLDFTNEEDLFKHYITGFDIIAAKAVDTFNQDLSIYTEFMKRLVKTKMEVEPKEGEELGITYGKMSLFQDAKYGNLPSGYIFNGYLKDCKAKDYKDYVFNNTLKAFNDYIDNKVFDDLQQYLDTKTAIETYFNQKIDRYIKRVKYYRWGKISNIEETLVDPSLSKEYLESQIIVDEEEYLKSLTEIITDL